MHSDHPHPQRACYIGAARRARKAQLQHAWVALDDLTSLLGHFWTATSPAPLSADEHHARGAP